MRSASSKGRCAAWREDPRIGGVQGRRLFYNAGQNLRTRMQGDEFAIMQTCLQRARQAAGAFVTFAGNGLLVRREALDAAGGGDGEGPAGGPRPPPRAPPGGGGRAA